MSAVLFIGNGLNRAEKITENWSKLISDLTQEKDQDIVKALTNTFGYEFVEYALLNSNTAKSSGDIKRMVISQIATAVPHSNFNWKKTLHYRFTRLPISRIITTNYDYALEYAINPGFEQQNLTSERLYSLRRKQIVDGKTIYHIHGECARADSVCLGFEHYAGSLEKIRNSIVKSTMYKKAEDGLKHSFALADVLNGFDPIPDQWFYRFFTDDLYFVGIGLDFSEIDLWWLLSYRKRVQSEGKIKLTNRIIFMDTESPAVRRSSDYRAKMELLKTYDVEVVACDGKGYKSRYRNAAEYIRKQV